MCARSLPEWTYISECSCSLNASQSWIAGSHPCFRIPSEFRDHKPPGYTSIWWQGSYPPIALCLTQCTSNAPVRFSVQSLQVSNISLCNKPVNQAIDVFKTLVLHASSKESHLPPILHDANRGPRILEGVRTQGLKDATETSIAGKKKRRTWLVRVCTEGRARE